MSDRVFKLYSGAVVQDSDLNDRQIRVVASDPTPDRVGDIMVPSGCRLEQFKRNPIVLANHDPSKPIGTAEATIKSNRVEALITFAPPRISPTADEFCGLSKAGVLRAVSVGFNPIESEPISGGGLQYTEWELLELSVVTVPANPAALVIARDYRGGSGLVPLTEEGWTAFLRVDFPDLSARDATWKYLARKRLMTPHERILEAKRKSDFAKRFTEVEAVRQKVREDISKILEATVRQKVREDISKILEATVRQKVREDISKILEATITAPLYGATAAEFCANIRAYDQGRGSARDYR